MMCIVLTITFHSTIEYFADLGNCMDYTKKHENNQAPDKSNFLFLEQMYGNIEGTSHYSTVNATEDLYCTSGSDEVSNIFEKRRLVRDKMGLVDLSITENSGSMGERYLKRSQYEEIRVQDFANGVKIVSTISLV